MIWWIAQAQRANSELSMIAVLNEESAWLSRVLWRFEDKQLIVEFDITHKNELFLLKMIYPVAFPETPPLVLTRDKKRISGHQYAYGGELCLEYRPDNWNPNIDGSLIILSAYKLISGERPVDNKQMEIRDGHDITLGQEFRSVDFRYLVTLEIIEVFKSLNQNKPYTIKTRCSILQNKCTVIVEDIEDGSEEIFSSGSVHTCNSWNRDGLIIHDHEELFNKKPQLNEILLVFKKIGHIHFLNDFLNQEKNFDFIFGCGKEWALVSFFRINNEWNTNTYQTILTPPTANRLPRGYEALKGKKVGVVGCGSVGSKIATSLARSGVEDFLLIDDDIFFAGNLVRNELDMESIGFHKVDALKQRIMNINPLSEVKVRRVSLGGQESSATISSVFEGLGKCQIIVDATANDRAFNLNAAVSKRYCIPLIWCSVFAGGVGGTVVRLLPNRDPIPLIAKAQINAWYKAHNVLWEGVDEKGYATKIGEETPMIASDADVSVISSHATRFALDALVYREDTKFPYSAYVIGLSHKWIFTEPFDTRPIKLKAEGHWGQEVGEINQEEVEKLFKEIQNMSLKENNDD